MLNVTEAGGPRDSGRAAGCQTKECTGRRAQRCLQPAGSMGGGRDRKNNSQATEQESGDGKSDPAKEKGRQQSENGRKQIRSGTPSNMPCR